MPATFETLCTLDAYLERAGHHPLTPWWHSTMREFYEHPTARELVARVGRSGAKSHTAVKVAFNEVLNGDWVVPPGEVHFFAFCSTNTDEAAQRLRLIDQFLRDLVQITGISLPFEKLGREQIILPDLRLGFRVFPAQVSSASGFRCIGYCCDELAKWKSSDRFTNPANEVVSNLGATSAPHPAARKLLISSPLAMVDYHFERVELGNTPDQVIAKASSWVANPSITEAQTRKLEPDLRVWKREYAAVPQAAALAAFSPEAVTNAFRVPSAIPKAQKNLRRIGIIDASSGKKDTWAWGICGWREVDGAPRLLFDRVDGFEGDFWNQKSGDEIVALVADHLKANDIHDVAADQRESLMLKSSFGRHGIKFHELPWASTNKERAVAMLRRWFAEGQILLPEHEKLRHELLSFEEIVRPSGAFTFGARGSGHDDYVALLITAAMADAADLLPGSPSCDAYWLKWVQMVDAFSEREAKKQLKGGW